MLSRQTCRPKYRARASHSRDRLAAFGDSGANWLGLVLSERVGGRLTSVNFAFGLLGSAVGLGKPPSARATIQARAVAAFNILARARGANLVALTLTGFRPLGDHGRL
jgi:hypothetical protein